MINGKQVIILAIKVNFDKHGTKSFDENNTYSGCKTIIIAMITVDSKKGDSYENKLRTLKLELELAGSVLEPGIIISDMERGLVNGLSNSFRQSR